MGIAQTEVEKKFSGWNFQPGREGSSKDSVCPMYQLVEHCAELAGLNLAAVRTTEKFCGWMGAADSEPYTMCAEVSTRLKKQIELARSEIKIPRLPMGSVEQVEVDERDRALRLEAKREEIIARWKGVLVKNSPVEDDKVEGISDEEATHYAELCYQQLNRHAAGEGEEKNGDNCKERPTVLDAS